MGEKMVSEEAGQHCYLTEGIIGNSHFMFQEKNNDVIANHIEAWIQKKVK